MRAGLHLIKHLLTSGARNVLLQLGVTAAAASEIQQFKRKLYFRNDYADNIKIRSGRYYEVS